jgi:hypothetical protein
MSYPLGVFTEDSGNPDIHSWVGTSASCSPVQQLPSCCIAAHLSPTSLLLHAHLHNHPSLYQSQAVVPANLFHENTVSSRKPSISIDSLDDISINGSEFSLSIEDENCSENGMGLTRRSSAKSGSSDSLVSDASLKASLERRGHRKHTSESNAR